MKDKEIREEAAKIASDICGLIEHKQAWVVMYALCSVICAVHRSASTGSDREMIDAVENTLWSMLDGAS